MRTLHLTVEIKIDDENIHMLYPDFSVLYPNMEDFLEYIFDSIETDGGPSNLELLGYSVVIKSDKNTMPLSYSLN